MYKLDKIYLYKKKNKKMKNLRGMCLYSERNKIDYIKKYIGPVEKIISAIDFLLLLIL